MSIRRTLGHLIGCKQATRLVSKGQEKSLGPADRLLLKLHLDWCAACRRFDQQMRVLRRAMQKYRE